MPAKRFNVSVRRHDPTSGESPWFQDYEVEVAEGVTVLETLLRIQAEQDGTLAFRYSCRGAVCGSCAMVVNGEVSLACRTQVHGLGNDRITVEPLPNLEVVRDLVVDMDFFLEKNLDIRPWFDPADPDPPHERLVDPSDWTEAEPYTNCILCASCHAVCPVTARDPSYLGPAALAKHHRFLADARDGAAEKRLALVDDDAGVWGCDVVWNCSKICPKGVRPTQGILASRERLKPKS
jgi:succinate dehydrogenase / fumarate reductase iron-sulfur subunit